ncbi:MAG: glycoside-pentoside-hexuronide (GPH):cation symporter [Candidatus Fimivicinus sp.]|nr:glycoside-pentoside-hexuronide (GPH):cation symporter [Oscillospiraceae bacterium]MDY5590397.1 glycoside-pentoside-hexuronide (GPH):cation symporter [Candidatus Fimivicinus sp.]
METKYLSRKEKLSFTVAAFGRSGIYTIMTMFYMVFLVDVVFQGMKNAGVTASSIILAGRIFDAANDPIMGMIVDRTRTKWGKMRPYLLFSPVPIAITTVLLFWAPGFASDGAKIAYAAVTYILWGVMFTIQDVPFWGLSAVITPNEQERTSFLSTARLGSTFGGILPSLLIPVLRNSTLGLKNGYLVGATIFALLGAALSSLAFFNTKERVEQSEKTPSLKESVQMVAKNKVLLIVIMAAILGSTMVIANISADYISNYLILQNGNNGFVPKGTVLTTLTIAIGVGMVPAMAVFPLLRKKFSLKQIYIGSSLFGVIAHMACYLIFVGNVEHINLYLLWVCLFFMGFPLGIYNVITYALIADSVDYIEWKTGKRSEGVCFAFQTFLSKVTAGIAGVATGIVLDKGGYIEPDPTQLDAMGKQILATQSPDTLKWLLFMVTVLPAIGFALTIIPMLFNDYTGKKKDQIQQELSERHEHHEQEKAAAEK